MSYVIDMKNGRSVFLKLEDYEYIRIMPVKDCAIVNVYDDRKPKRPTVKCSYLGVEKFTLVSD